MLMTAVGVNSWFRTAPVVNNLCSLYSCVTPPNCAIALAHQVSATAEPACYRKPGSRRASEFRHALYDLADSHGQRDLGVITSRFERINGQKRLYHPANGLEFCISRTHTLREFREWDKDGLICWIWAAQH
jgi:hypothetical protein